MASVMQITVLKDNTATRPGVLPGHGLALLVESDDRRVLLDTGPDDTLLVNATVLGVSLYPLDAIVLSHGHYDHTGGLASVLTVTGPVKVVAHPEVFERTFSGPSPNSLRDIGMPLTRNEYEALGARFELTAMPRALGRSLLTTGHNPPLHLEPHQRSGLWRQRHDRLHADDFRDDCSLIAKWAGSAAVLTGCAHPGLVNILCKVRTIAPQWPPRTVLGGLHLGAAAEEEVAQLARDLAGLGVHTVLPCHCTGETATRVLADRFAGEVVPVGAGSVIEMHANGDVAVKYAAPC